MCIIYISLQYARFVPPMFHPAPGPPEGPPKGPHLPWSDPASRHHRARARAAHVDPKNSVRHRPGHGSWWLGLRNQERYLIILVILDKWLNTHYILCIYICILYIIYIISYYIYKNILYIYCYIIYILYYSYIYIKYYIVLFIYIYILNIIY